MEAFLRGEPYDPGNYKDWVVPLLSDDLWNRYEVVATEYRMADTSEHGGIAGSCDCIIRHKVTGDYVLADLKTLSIKGSKRNVSAQLGGYLSLLQKCKPEIKISRCLAIWSWPLGHKDSKGHPQEVGTTKYSTQECLERYEKAKTEFLSKQPQI